MAWWTLLRTVETYRTNAKRRRVPAPSYQVGQRVWRSTANLHLGMENKKLAPLFVGPFPFSKVVNPVAVHLRLPRPLCIHLTFHVSKVKPVNPCALVSPANALPPAWFINGGPAYRAKCQLTSRPCRWGLQYWWIGRAMGLKSVPGFLLGSSSALI